ncbi:hypothetical protein [Pseudophaeobacter sp.]|jgi:hypothetical protein|uniref:hypothetical protein n=1 Tax=Pseudophaeobacter sp. TaxID=1971739 RepID=UPI0025F170A0|nr:hypothetical protein [uncultured Pseudophaeobacter sp.]
MANPQSGVQDETLGEACFTFKFRTQGRQGEYRCLCGNLARRKPVVGVYWRIAAAKGNQNAPAGSYFPGFLSVLIAEICKVPIEKDGEFDPWVEAAKGGAGQIVPFSTLGKLALFLSD